ncbi:MAG: zinc ABC transporter substrate-binding protein [Melioribacteraceae bacterium]|nr:zinc ABC transporter substrate-binding protein [Melioribacteraceae bacterium]
MREKLIFILIIFIFLSCKDKVDDDEKKVIVVTIPPYKDLVQRITLDNFNVICSIPEGATPHHFDPSPKLIQSLSVADYYLAVGKYMEFEDVWLEKIKGINKNIKIFDLSQNVDYLKSDPHIWLSPARLRIISENIFNAIVDIDSSKQNEFYKNYVAVIDSLNIIENELRESFSKINSKVILSYHGSWEYFADDFGFTQISIEKGSKSASAKEMKEIMNIVSNSNVSVIFVDPQHGKSSAEVIAQDLDLVLDILNPLPTNVFKNFYEMKEIILRYYQ